MPSRDRGAPVFQRELEQLDDIQRLLRCNSKPGEQLSDCRQADANAKLLLN